jgi:hypothetical protein
MERRSPCAVQATARRPDMQPKKPQTAALIGSALSAASSFSEGSCASWPVQRSLKPPRQPGVSRWGSIPGPSVLILTISRHRP